MNKLLSRDIYEITTDTTSIHGVKLRWRIRKLCLQNVQNVLLENDEQENIVRFAIFHNEWIEKIQAYLSSILSDVHVTKVMENISNPILSKLKTNDESRYTL